MGCRHVGVNGGAGNVCVCDDRHVIRMLSSPSSPPPRLPHTQFYSRRGLGDEKRFGVVRVQGILMRCQRKRLRACLVAFLAYSRVFSTCAKFPWKGCCVRCEDLEVETAIVLCPFESEVTNMLGQGRGGGIGDGGGGGDVC